MEQPPNNSEQATRNAEQPLRNAEQALRKGERPSNNSEQAPSNSEQPSNNATELQRGYSIYKTAGGADIAVFHQSGEQQAATLSVNALRDKAEGQAATLTRIANTIFMDDIEASAALGLNMPDLPAPKPPDGEPPTVTRPSRSQAAFLGRAHRLYEGALGNTAFFKALEKVGYNEARLKAELADVTALEAADIVQEREKGESAGSHAVEQQARADLKTWLRRYKNLVTADLNDQPT